jgi:hypothetical protein
VVGVLHLIGQPTGAQHGDDGPPRPPRGSDCSFAAPSPLSATICDPATGPAGSTPFPVTVGGSERRGRCDSRPPKCFCAGSIAICYYYLRLITVQDAGMGTTPAPTTSAPVPRDRWRCTDIIKSRFLGR